MGRNIFDTDHWATGPACGASSRSRWRRTPSSVKPTASSSARSSPPWASWAAFAALPDEFGGAGISDFWFNAILAEEATCAAVPLPWSDPTCTPTCACRTCWTSRITSRRRLAPGTASGETIAAIGKAKPGTGSDLARRV